MELNVDIDSLALQDALQLALLQSIPQAARDKMIQEALKALVTPPKNSYGANPPTPLQRIYDRAIERAIYNLLEAELLADSGLATDLQMAMALVRPSQHVDTDRHNAILEAIIKTVLEYRKD